MPATTNVNFRTVVHEKSSGMVMFFPDVCKTPAPPAGPIPIPYPNIAQSTDTDKGSTKVKIDGCPVMLKDSNFKTSTGDEAGSAGGLMSSTTKGKAEFLNYSFDVKIEGKNVARLGDMMLGNKQSSPNTPPMPEVQAPLLMIPAVEVEENEDIQLDKLEETDSDAEDMTENTSSDSRSLDSGAKPEKKPSQPDAPEEESAPEPTIKAKWSKAEVTPDHNDTYPPASAPTDTVPEEAKVVLEIDLTDVPDGKQATIEIRNAKSDALVKNGKLKGLKVKGGKVVDIATGQPPEWIFRAEQGLWNPWDAPFFYFSVKVDFKSLKAETPKDYVAKEGETLRLTYWHVCASDYLADHTGNPNRDLSTGDEMREIAGILNGQAHHRAFEQSFNQNAPAANEWGSVLRNTFVYHHASHGSVRCRQEPESRFMEDDDANPTFCPNDRGHSGRSIIKIGEAALGDLEIKSKSDVPSVPRYLVYVNTCKTGWDSSFADAFVSRGTRNVLAFRKSIPDADARQMARDFYTKWTSLHKTNPEKIPEVFFDVGAAYYKTMKPALYGKGGGKIKDPDAGPTILEYAAIIVGAVALGAAIGIGLSKVLK